MASEPDALAENGGADEEAISPALRRRLQQCYEHGVKLASADKCDHDYVNAMFAECVAHDPGNLVYVEAFLDNLQKKYNNNKRGARFKFGGKGAFKKAVSKKDWREVLRLGPDVLKSNPWDVPALRSMAQACEELGLNEVELRYLKNALDANPKNVEVNRHCGRSLARMGQFDQAIACWHRVEELRKGDKEAAKMISDLSVEKAREQAGMGPSRPIGASRAKSAAAKRAAEASAAPEATEEAAESQTPAARREIPLTRRQQLERAIADNPESVENYLELAELFADEDRHGDAERTLTKALEASGGDLKVRERLEDAQVARARHQLAIAEKRAGVEKTDDANALAERLRDDLNRREIELLAARSQRYPDDLRLCYELGLRLKRAGNYAEAVRQLQEARKVADLKAVATVEMGECLQHLKQFAKAMQYYTRAAELADNEPDCKRLALYRAGVLATGLRELDVAERHLRELEAIDPDYKDLPARLDKLQTIRDKG